MAKTLDDRLSEVESIIRQPSFLENKGLGNEVGYYVFDYPPEQELMVRSRIAEMKEKFNTPDSGFRIVEFDLYDMVIDILIEKGYLEKCFEFEKKKGFERITKSVGNMLRISSDESLIVQRIREGIPERAVVFLTGIGKIYPILRSHKILNNLHQAIDQVPVIMFYPGKDVYVFDQMYDMNLEYYKELTMYIIAGKKALEIARNGRMVELRNKAELTQDQLDIQVYRDYSDACKRFEKRLFDLETTRLVSIQMAPQIRLLQQADQEVVDKLRSNVINTIPLWRNQMVLALGIEHSRRALDAQSAITEMTNEMFRVNAERLKQGAIDAAAAAEKAVVDVETLRVVNQEIISSINEVVRIHEEGTKRRMEAQNELAKIEDELKAALLEAGSR